ncbi:MAG: hypothetical protein PHP26_03615 [Syntrophomonas sp.]|nr:hypothetical protein [Syntrophomonas sp.]MDD3879063.1 hypothetical protein [Syntrophomonas sp.]
MKRKLISFFIPRTDSVTGAGSDFDASFSGYSELVWAELTEAKTVGMVLITS